MDAETLVEQENQCSTCPMNKGCAIEFNSVGVCYPEKPKALSQLSLQVGKGEHLALMGVSGSGKSTLLRCISGRIKPSIGNVIAHGRVATIHQDLHLVKQHTALANVLHGAMGRYSFFRTLFGFPKKEKQRALALLERVGLARKANIKVAKLSGGEQQRVAIARALMQEPDIILADEPIASLDEVNAHAIMKLLQGLAKERELTIVSVLHDSFLAKNYCNRVVVLKAGQVARIIPIESSEQGEIVSDRCCLETDHIEEEEIPPINSKIAKPAAQILGVLVFLWACTALFEFSSEADGALGGLIAFLGQIFPRSYAEFEQIPWGTLAGALVETLHMAAVGTILGIMIAWPLSALAARTVCPGFVRRPVRLLLNVMRTVPSLIWALLFVAAVGLGSFAGILALVAYSVGYLSKFFYEAFEAVDPGTPQALKEIGASGLQRFFHAIWPASKPIVLSSCIFMLEYNVRAASILGVVDAGGIGFYIKQYIDFRFFPAVTASLILLLGVVLVLDVISSRFRAHLTHSL